MPYTNIKAGARHSASDQQHIQAIHDSAVACGASCGADEGDGEADDMGPMAEKAIKGIMDDPGYYAQHECSDIMQASSALGNLAMLLMSELSEEDEDMTQVSSLCSAARTLIEFIDGELDELEEAAKADAEEDATIGHEPMKAITAREDVSAADKKRAVGEYGDVTFADEKNKKYPLDTEAHIRSAWNYIGQEKNQAMYSAAEVTAIKNKIVAAWKKTIDKAGPPAAQGKAFDLPHVEGSAIKAVDGDTIRGYAVLFGDADHHDIERDYYTKSTDFWMDHFGWPRPITYQHGLDPATRAAPVVGHWTKGGVDDVGVWLEGQIDRAHKYYAAVKQLIARGYLKLSSDSAPQWVQRERQDNGATFVKTWPLVTSSVTVSPMEPRMLPVEVKAFLAELGLEGIDDNSQEAINQASARADGLKAGDDERARALLLELDLLELETQ